MGMVIAEGYVLTGQPYINHSAVYDQAVKIDGKAVVTAISGQAGSDAAHAAPFSIQAAAGRAVKAGGVPVLADTDAALPALVAFAAAGQAHMQASP
jgi:hypothetical protein